MLQARQSPIFLMLQARQILARTFFTGVRNNFCEIKFQNLILKIIEIKSSKKFHTL